MRKVLFIFGQLNDDDVEWMIDSGGRKFVAASSVLIRQGEPVDSVFIVLEGRLSVHLATQGDREIARLQAGEMVGEMSFLDARPPSATVRAMDDFLVFVLFRPVLAAKLEEDLGFAARFYRSLVIYLSNNLRERHRLMGYGEKLDLDADVDDVDELDPNVLDNVSLAGERFDRMLRRVTSA